jgi:hypothetical protein
MHGDGRRSDGDFSAQQAEHRGGCRSHADIADLTQNILLIPG